ncbi:MAG: thioredoxin family protein [Desulfurococcaceae archaeon]|jgi:thioredoxin-like negative regulator of GroEL
MYEVKSREELTRALKGNELVLIEYYEPGNKDCDIMGESIKEFAKHAGQVMLFCRVNVREHPEVADVDVVPTIRLYYRGELVFEQIGSLSTVDLNLKVIRRSIREVLNARNIRARI